MSVAGMTERVERHRGPVSIVEQTPRMGTAQLLADGFRPISKETRGGVYLSVTRYGIGLSMGLVRALGSPHRAQVYVHPDKGIIAIVPAAAEDMTALVVKDGNTAIHSDILAAKLAGLGWQRGRYAARIEHGIALCEQQDMSSCAKR